MGPWGKCLGRRPERDTRGRISCNPRNGSETSAIVLRLSPAQPPTPITIYPFDASMLRPHERHPAPALTSSCSMQAYCIFNVLSSMSNWQLAALMVVRLLLLPESTLMDPWQVYCMGCRQRGIRCHI